VSASDRRCLRFARKLPAETRPMALSLYQPPAGRSSADAIADLPSITARQTAPSGPKARPGKTSPVAKHCGRDRRARIWCCRRDVKSVAARVAAGSFSISRRQAPCARKTAHTASHSDEPWSSTPIPSALSDPQADRHRPTDMLQKPMKNAFWMPHGVILFRVQMIRHQMEQEKHCRGASSIRDRARRPWISPGMTDRR